jgi:iron complex transport system substrate-binding protein
MNAQAMSIEVIDDSGQTILLKQAAKKVISLSPGLTELVYAAGGENIIKGVVSYSDYPEQAKQLPQVGSYNALDMEQIINLQPDLIVTWQSGNPSQQLEKLKKLGFTLYISEPKEFNDIPNTIKNLGKLMATEAIAQQNAHQFNTQLQQLKITYSTQQHQQQKPRTFIQIWNNPVMTVNSHHLISKVIEFCGGENIFAHSFSLTNTPSIESILTANPDIIIATGMANSSKIWLKRWQQWGFLSAVKNQRLYSTNPDHLVRHTPRILLGIKAVCQLINNQ